MVSNLPTPITRCRLVNSLPAAILTSQVCSYLDIVDVSHLSAACKNLRLLLRSGAIEYLRSIAPSAPPPKYIPLLADDLLADCLLHREGLSSVLRHRYLAQAIGLGPTFSVSVAKELRVRSTVELPSDSRIRFLSGFTITPSPCHHFQGRCSFAERIREALIENPPTSVVGKNERFLAFLLKESSSADSQDDSDHLDDQSSNKKRRHSIASSFGLNVQAIKDLRRERFEELADSPEPCPRRQKCSKRDLAEWARMFALSSRLSGNHAGLTQSTETAPPSHHIPLADAIFDYLSDSQKVWMEDSLEDEIERDINRTLPQHFLFRAGAESELKKALFHVLRAVAILEPGMGYCQGMNFIAGVLLIETLCPATAFWGLLAMIRQQSCSGLFCPGVPVLRIKLMQFRKFSADLLPTAFKTLNRLSLNTDLVGHQCFVTAFAYFLHPTVLIRFWDLFFRTGWKVMMTLGIVILKLLEPALCECDDAEAALKVIQNFRGESSKLSFDDSKGLEFYRRLLAHYAEYSPFITAAKLQHHALEHFISTLRLAIRNMELPIVAPSERLRNVPSSQIGSEQSEITNKTPSAKPEESDTHTEDRVQPPFILVPRFGTKQDRRALREEDIHAIIINYVTQKTAKCFELLPVDAESVQSLEEAVASPQMTTTSASTGEEPTSAGRRHSAVGVSWSLLASSQSPADHNKLSLVRGRGTLPLSGFYVLIDTRMYMSENHRFSQRDPLSEFLFPGAVHRIEEAELLRLCTKGTVADLAIFLERDDGHITLRQPEPKPKEMSAEEETAWKCRRGASSLLNWIRMHNQQVEGEEQRRAVGRGGFIVAPLRAVIQAKINFDMQEMQLAQDREIFEEKIMSIGKQLTMKQKEVERWHQKRDGVAAAASRLQKEKTSLMRELHGTVVTPLTLQKSNVADNDSLWSRVGGWLGWTSARENSRQGTRDLAKTAPHVISMSPTEVSMVSTPLKVTEIEDENSVERIGNVVRTDRKRGTSSSASSVKSVKFLMDNESPEGYVLTPGEPITPPHPENEDELPSRKRSTRSYPDHSKTIARMEKRLRNVERAYANQRTRLNDTTSRLMLLEDSIKEAEEIKATLLRSYHELATRQEMEEIRMVEDTLRTSCDWANESLPFALLRIAGALNEEFLSTHLLMEIPDLYSELISLPLFWPQFKQLFLQGPR